MRVDFNQNFFELFGMSDDFDLDPSALTQRWQTLQKEFHPDNYAAASAAEQRYAVQFTSFVNEAFNTLKKPLSRAVYLLQLKGVDIDAESDTRMSPEFLMLQMEMREKLADLRMSDSNNDSAALEAELDSLSETVAEQVERIQADFKAAINGSDVERARESARQWQFAEKLNDEIRQLENDLAD